MKKRIISTLLVLALMLSISPVSVFAEIKDFSGNTSQENDAILSQLSELTGEDGKEAYAFLETLGLLDENGSLNVSQSIELDGEAMSLEEVRELLNNSSTDLSRVADVDGTPIALGDLKTIIQIETELARIKDTYFSDRTFSDEQLVELQSLMDQIETEGIRATLMGTDTAYPTLRITPNTESGAANPLEENASSFTSSSGKITRTYNLSLSGTIAEDTGYSFSWDIVKGLLPNGFLDAKLELLNTATSQTIEVPKGTSFSFGSTAASFVINNASQFSGTLTLTFDGSLTDKLGYGISGNLNAFIDFAAGSGLGLSDGSTTSDSFTLPITVDKPDAFTPGYSWLKSMSGLSNYDKNITNDSESGYNEKINPRWEIVNLSDANMSKNYSRLMSTAKEIYSANSPVYRVAAKLSLYDPNVSGGAYMFLGMPIGYDSASPANQLTVDKYTWNDNELNLSSNPLKTTADGNPFVYINMNDPGSDGQEVAIVMTSAAEGRPPITLNAVWPTNPVFRSDFSDPGTTVSLTVAGYQRTVSSEIAVYDAAAPTVVSVSVPAGTYSSGQYVPILLDFSEPVKANKISMTINGKTYTAAQLKMDTTGRKAVAMYQVGDVDATTILVSSINDTEDLTGYRTLISDNSGNGWSFGGTVTLKSALMKNSLTGISVTPDAIAPENLAAGTTVNIALNQEEAYRTKYAAYDTSGNPDKKAPFMAKVTNTSTGSSQNVQFYLSESGATISATASVSNLSASASDNGYEVEIYAYEGASDTAGTLILEQSASFTVKAATFVNGISVSYPADDKTELSLSDTYRPKLGVTFTGTPSFTSGSWTSSDTSIATIDGDGQVVLTSSAVGTVSFTFTADDGGLTDPSSVHVKSCTSKAYTVTAGSSPALVIPDKSNLIIAQQNASSEVLWSSNSTYFSTSDFVFTIDLFEGNFTANELSGKTPIYTTTAEKTKNSADIPGTCLTTLSSGNTPAYTVRISMPHPLVSSQRLSAVSYIQVNPAPAMAHLSRPAGGLYLLDSQTAELNWSVENYIEGSTTGSISVYRIATDANGDDVKTTVTDDPIFAQTGNYTLTPAAVSGLKDTYMVTLKAKNPSDQGYSSDSFPLYVYNADALAIEADGKKLTSLTLDNEGAVSGALPTDTADILALREELALIEFVGINFNDYNWSQLKDGISWSTSDANIVSVNYKQGGIYEDISNFSMSTYLPETKMALSSVTDGTATIKATHANTGMSSSVTVDVKTLRNKFFLFQLSPMQKTALTYTDGKGVEKNVNTNSEGVLALYEPDGIVSDISLKATDGDGSVWLGTIYKNNILSGERDTTKLQLYPLNTFKLRQAAKVEIHLTEPDSSPYTGTLTLRGGVYKNGGYCQTAEILGNVVPNVSAPLKDGKAAQTVNIGADGMLTIYMDSTQFWSEENGENDTDGAALNSKDDLQYIFELTNIGAYCPLLVYSNGNLTADDLMHSAESVITLDASGGSVQPFISNQTMDYGLSGHRLIDVRKSKGHVGPNETYPDTTLITTVLLWGSDVTKTDFELKMCDECGYVPSEQSSKMIIYPFSTISVVQNSLTLSKTTITDSGWIPEGKDAGLKTRLSDGDRMLMELPVNSRVVDLTQVPKLTDSEDVTGLLVDLQKDSGTSSASMNGGDSITSNLMGLMSNLSGPVDGTNFKMIISPGEDNSVFKAFIWAGYDSLGLDDVDYTSSGLFVDTSLAQSDLSVAPSLNDLTDMARGKYNPSESMDEALNNQAMGKGTSSTDFGGQLEGYFEAQIQYNFELGKWEIYVLGGGFTIGFGASYTYTINGQAGPVPVTASFNVGGSIQLDFKAAVRYREVPGLEWASTVTSGTVNDYLTTLRINAYVNAFGGLGFDYSVLALKIGIFGKITVDSQNKFLSRTYLADEAQRQVNGQGVQISGEVGIKFVAQFLFISYEFVLASAKGGANFTFNDGASIDNYWNNTTSGLHRSMNALSSSGGLEAVSSSATLQSREYLEQFARSWGSSETRVMLSSIDSTNALETLQTNAYPYSLPLVSDDGKLLIYAFDNNSKDVSKTRVFATALSGDSYPEGSEVTAPAGFDGFGDSGAVISGAGTFAAAAWVRQSAELPDKAEGDSLTEAEQALLMNGTEIVASVYNGTAWTSKRLTENSSPDLAPVVATNGTKAIVAWRSVYAADSGDLLNFSKQDDILYCVYSEGNWSAPKKLYNGTSGAVKGIHAAMLQDGSSAVVYTLDTNTTDNGATDYEVGYSVIDTAGEVAISSIITNDSWLDENPQVAAVKFDDGDERFVLGWHSVRDDFSDIRLAAIDKHGALSNSFIDSLAAATNGSSVEIGGDFSFAKMNVGLNDISNLSILWSKNVVNSSGETDHSILKAIVELNADVTSGSENLSELSHMSVN